MWEGINCGGRGGGNVGEGLLCEGFQSRTDAAATEGIFSQLLATVVVH